jgi:hypothetical protein
LLRKTSCKEASWGYHPQESPRLERKTLLSKDNIRLTNRITKKLFKE